MNKASMWLFDFKTRDCVKMRKCVKKIKKTKPGQSQNSQWCGPGSQRPPSCLEAAKKCCIKSLSKIWSKEQQGNLIKSPHS